MHTYRRTRGHALVALVLVAVLGAGAASLPAAAGDDPARPPERPSAVDPALLDPDAYPERGFGEVKGLQPDFWPDSASLAPGLATVAVNLFWAEWEPVEEHPPCAAGRLEFDGRCFRLPTGVDDEIRTWTSLGVAVTGVVYGTPAWARGARPCTPIAAGFEVFCVPDDPSDYARFGGLLAERYDGASGHGRVVDFVIQNEVNMNQWFNVGCGAGVPCDLDGWVQDYADLYNRAYDAIRASQPQARVLFSFTHHFQPALDAASARHPVYAIQTFLPRLVPLVGGREWSIALHPYVRAILPAIDARDLPYATLGNIGVLPGWLRATYPNDPHAWEVQLTEVGLHNDGRFDVEQRDVLCRSFRNILGTPGITSFIYHRLIDHPQEFLLKLGLLHQDGTPKPAFDLWRHATDPQAPDCGFENDGQTVIRHGVDPDTDAHWYTSREVPAGYDLQADEWRLAYAAEPATALLYECGAGASSYLWTDASCRGDTPLGPVGWIGTAAAPGRTVLYACEPSGAVPTVAEQCAPNETAHVLGYLGDPVPPTTTVTSTTTTSPTTAPPDRPTGADHAPSSAPVRQAAPARPSIATPTFAG